VLSGKGTLRGPLLSIEGRPSLTVDRSAPQESVGAVAPLLS